jgi:hypothetical protein
MVRDDEKELLTVEGGVAVSHFESLTNRDVYFLPFELPLVPEEFVPIAEEFSFSNVRGHERLEVSSIHSFFGRRGDFP